MTNQRTRGEPIQLAGLLSARPIRTDSMSYCPVWRQSKKRSPRAGKTDWETQHYETYWTYGQ